MIVRYRVRLCPCVRIARVGFNVVQMFRQTPMAVPDEISPIERTRLISTRLRGRIGGNVPISERVIVSATRGIRYYAPGKFHLS